jgi:hypothetical protein
VTDVDQRVCPEAVDEQHPVHVAVYGLRFYQHKPPWKLCVRRRIWVCDWLTDVNGSRDNHDNPRFLSQQSDYSLYQSALLYSMYSEGIPIVYYGSEQVQIVWRCARQVDVPNSCCGDQGFNGGASPADREPMWPSGFAESGQLYEFIKTIVGYRKSVQLWNQPQVGLVAPCLVVHSPTALVW